MCLRDKVDDAIQQVEEKLGMEDFTEMDDTEVAHKIQTLYRETLLRCYNFGCEVNNVMILLDVVLTAAVQYRSTITVRSL